ncbi:hypothetical protein OR62_10220 [Clostridium tetani]|uniref:Uncharacterized protein n=1 Tax=Clostridium tetani TaxID=1513 RepID=A0ABY0ESG6_CLOTA|nr:hypothetical protein [Clostridium tetani]KHO38300.1 hypothetical protein OR62_10220 [Clostridium tetani]RXI40296.1 hypothetical protein DP129_03945 [Clostridium tetani]RXI56600.1 hypothetical protein DP131_07240 [Clostridium tetani]RXI70474.1 hypothetical protein DQN76_06980 [Clostridium tetani]
MIEIIDSQKCIKDEFGFFIFAYNENMVYTENYNSKNEYRGVYIFNYISMKTYNLKFTKTANIISYGNSNKTMYYGSFRKCNDKYLIDIYKVDCENLKDEYIKTIGEKFNINSEKNINDILYGNNFIGINERYSILLLPHSPYDEPFFQIALLIDSFEKQIYSIKDAIGDMDTIFRTREIETAYHGEYIMFKTGRICAHEKREIWEHQKEDNKFVNYHDELQSIVVCNTNKFVNNVKNSRSINKNNILKTCYKDEGLSIIGNYDGNISYSVHKFEHNLTCIYIYNFRLQEKENIIVQDFYDYIRCFDGKLYGFKCNGMEEIIFDVSTGKKIIKSPKRVSYIDDIQLITEDINIKDNKIERPLEVIDLKTNKIIDKYICNRHYLDVENNKLILI